MTTNPNQAFFCTNSHWFDDTETAAAAFQEVTALFGFRPVHYTGLKLDIRQSSMDREVRADFYDSRVIVLYLGEPKRGGDLHDNWVLQEMGHALELGKTCLVYTSADFPVAVLCQYGIEANAKKVADSADFKKQLTADLGRLQANRESQ